MMSRIHRLWQPGCSRPRVFLPDFWMKLVEQPTVGHKRLPKNAAAFEVDLRMSRLDVREYLEKIYKYPVRDVRTYIKAGEILWDHPKDREKRRALWKEEDKKIALVFFRKDFVVEIPDLFPEQPDQVENAKDFEKKDQNLYNKHVFNKERAGIGELLPV